MIENLQFKISSELKNIIGRDLINDDFIAIYELVKNSFDAKARNVEVIFKRVKSRNWAQSAKIFIKDYGDGMSYSDIRDKWLFVGYSRKREEQKTFERTDDYRNKITKRRAVAGAKGIGRFSCDRLGSNLKLYSKQLNDDFFNVLDMNWDNFEEDPNREFQTINVKYEKKPRLDIEIDTSDMTKGTILEISSLREPWNREKILKLKRHLQRLINPGAIGEEDFIISIQAEEFLEEDSQFKEDFDIINGPVNNIVFEQLGIKTTHLKCCLDEKGEKIKTELTDKGTFIYCIEEENNYKPLRDVTINLFYLNPQAKTAFTKAMGLEPVNYGSVFFYKNGIKINPCGNYGDDWLGLDKRKAQGMRRFLGNRDVMGRIEVNGYQPNFKEVSSRDGGVIKTTELGLLNELFKDKALTRLEKYVVEGINWDSERQPKAPEDIKTDTFKLVAKLVESVKDTGNNISFNKNLLEIYSQKQIERTPEIVKNIESLKKYITSEEAKDYLDLQAKTTLSSFRALKKKQEELERQLKLKEEQSLFLERVAGEDKKEILAVEHQIGLGALLVRKYLLPLRGKIVRGELVSRDDLLWAVENVLLQTQIMASMSRAQFLTKAKFKLSSEEIKDDLSLYIQQYIERVYVSFNEKELDEKRVVIRVYRPSDLTFVRIFDPMKIVVIIDNLISNSIKANSKLIEVNMSSPDGKSLQISFRDNGHGIRDADLQNIFEFGFSTTGGTGIGLYHIKKIMDEYGSIIVNNKLTEGVEFIIRVNKY